MADTSAVCIACRKDFDYTRHLIDRQTTTPGMTQYGLHCPHCRFFFHTHYLDAETRRLHELAAKAALIHGTSHTKRTERAFERAKAEYQAAFERLNPGKGS